MALKMAIKDIKKPGLWVFLKEIVMHPARTGAFFPSSRTLAHRMAKQVPLPLKDGGIVVELGAGTGVVTQALIDCGIPRSAIITIERSENLVQHLQKRFPDLKVIHGDAAHLTDLLGKQADQIVAVISCLPLRSLPKEMVKIIGQQLESLLRPDVPLIQFTYSIFSSQKYLPPHLRLTRSQRIWKNFPPARVEVYQQRLSE